MPPEGERDDTKIKDEDREVFYTASGRKVYGGGGIRPDYIVESPRAPEILFDMLRENLIFNYSVLFSNSRAELEPDFELDEQAMADFRAYLEQQDFDYDAEEFVEHQDVIKLRLRAQIARVRWDQDVESRVLAQADPQVQKALSLFDEAAELAENSAEGNPGRVPPARADLRADAAADESDEE